MFNRNEMELPAYLLALEKAGLVRIGSGKVKARFWEMPRPNDKQGLALKALLEERGE